MSTTQDRDSRHLHDVIARGYKDKPAKLKAIGRYGDRIEVVGTDPNKPICLPVADLYEFDDSLFAQLTEVSASGDSARLREVWGAAERFHPERLPASA